MPTTVTTSTAATATAYSNQRKIDRCQNGVLWSCFWDGTSTTTTSMDFYYSTDDGATWTKGGEFGFTGTGTTRTPNASLFIDLDDYAHVVYKDRHDGYIYYRRGTPNAGRTAWTWSAATQLSTNASNMDYPDIVAHREGTGWVAHIVWGFAYLDNSKGVQYARIGITSGGTISIAQSELTIGTRGSGSTHKYPSIDFNHTGDGKTVAGGTPHLYVAWSAGQDGSGYGIRFKKATYSGGSWTWGTEREIDSTRYVSGVTSWLNCLFDGTRVIIAGLVDAGAAPDIILHERDAADTATITRTLQASGAATSVWHGSATYDAEGNVYFIGRNSDESAGNHDVVYRKWTRSGALFGAEVVIDTGTGDAPYVSAKRGYSNGRIEFIYTDGTASPYSVTYDLILLPRGGPRMMV